MFRYNLLEMLIVFICNLFIEQIIKVNIIIYSLFNHLFLRIYCLTVLFLIVLIVLIATAWVGQAIAMRWILLETVLVWFANCICHQCRAWCVIIRCRPHYHYFWRVTLWNHLINWRLCSTFLLALFLHEHFLFILFPLTNQLGIPLHLLNYQLFIILIQVSNLFVSFFIWVVFFKKAFAIFLRLLDRWLGIGLKVTVVFFCPYLLVIIRWWCFQLSWIHFGLFVGVFVRLLILWEVIYLVDGLVMSEIVHGLLELNLRSRQARILLGMFNLPGTIFEI